MGKHGEQGEKERSSTDVEEGEEGGKSEHIAYVYVYICILLEAVWLGVEWVQVTTVLYD